MANQKKIQLFRQLFRGRREVSRYWESINGKSGYSPIIRNNKYIPLNDDFVLQHLKGQCILGVYPLLADNTCYFIAADLDNHAGNLDPLRDVKEYYEVCRINDCPCYVLRSKSGKGYHAYVFFKQPVPAWKARIVAIALLQEAQIYGENSSFDRLFPSQDKLSGKGLGNPIALPFQGRVARQGHTLLLNPETGFTEPYEKSLQYKIMAEINKVDEIRLNTLIDQWNLKGSMNYRSSGQATDYRKPDFNLMIRECAFIEHCRENAVSLSYMEWRAMISNVVRCKDGQRIVHELSKPYMGYDPAETDHQIERALDFPHPVSCRYIQNEITTKYCEFCKHYKKLTGSPAGFGYP